MPPEHPETLQDIAANPSRIVDFRKLREEFKANPDAGAELAAYERGDDSHEYGVLKGLIPEALVGSSPSRSDGPSWRKSDTFFTRYQDRNPPELVLSESPDSLIIRNDKSHDVRLYEPLYDPDSKDKTTSAGMSYLHLLVIPRTKVYNAVSVDNAECIREMIKHFERFWLEGDACDRAIKLVDQATEDRIRTLEEAMHDGKRPEGATTEGLRDLCEAVRSSSVEFAQSLRKTSTAIRTDQKSFESTFFYGFHAHPNASIGHLHMHVLPFDESLRRHSTRAHDWKTIPAQAIIDVIEQESRQTPVVCRNCFILP
ncbi:hypothetical protein HGRIS_014742 [Hohenbuehelia grisea]|uniref:Uncharacterized protein n=1 Tax=Hohenbuehelia grisea TaxID=104357 RepID=A0ABR3IQK9_9AGAR